MSHVLVDICGPLPTSHDGYKFLLTCVDRLSRYVNAFALRTATASECAQAFLHGWVKLHGLPKILTSDNGASFTANLWKNFMSDLGIEVKYTPLYRPQGMGMLERTHAPIKNALKASLIENGNVHQEKWIDYLPWVILGKNNAFQEDINSSASEMLYGFCGKIPGQLLRSHSDNDENLAEILSNQRKRNSKTAIQTSNHNAPQKPLKDIPENVKFVYTRQHKSTGLQPSFAGPFELVERLSKSTIKIKVGEKVSGEDIYEVRHLNDIKLSSHDSLTAPVSRPKRGRPSNADPNPTVNKPVASPVNKSIAAINFSVPPPTIRIQIA